MAPLEEPLAEDDERAQRALAALDTLSLPRPLIFRTLKRIHKSQVYGDQFWKFIEMENYMLLVDQVCELQRKQELRAAREAYNNEEHRLPESESCVRQAFTPPQPTGLKKVEPYRVPQSEGTLKTLASNCIKQAEAALAESNRRVEATKVPVHGRAQDDVRNSHSLLLHSRGGITPRIGELGRCVKRLEQSEASPSQQWPEKLISKKMKMSKEEEVSTSATTQIRKFLESSNACRKLKKPQKEVEARRPATGSADRHSNAGEWVEENKHRHNTKDLSRGEEALPIPIVNQTNSKAVPPSFYYISTSKVHEKAHVNFSLTRFGEDDCCPNCYKDCLTAPLPCACAGDTGGEFAYTQEGCLHERYILKANKNALDETSRHKHYCESGFHCPEERNKNEENPGKCKGHLVRDFIKECSCKCGCSKQCGNRVVQRGISRKLEVFWTPQGKGWGIRTLEDLPPGAFVFEYVGEILTNTEMYERNLAVEKKSNGCHTYPVLLDGDWGSEATLRDEEALCLDATHYGNVARFLNHRCFDANLLDMPVEIESPDRHYYHVAFFTNRQVNAKEELTWDYSIDFEDEDHPLPAFKCHCESEYCRGNKLWR